MKVNLVLRLIFYYCKLHWKKVYVHIVEPAECHCHTKETHDQAFIIQIRHELTMYNILQEEKMYWYKSMYE